MPALLLQLQLLLAALSAFLPLVPPDARWRAGEMLAFIGRALLAGGAAAEELDDLAEKLRAIRAEVERLAVSGAPLSASDLELGHERLQRASAAFRAALPPG